MNDVAMKFLGTTTVIAPIVLIILTIWMAFASPARAGECRTTSFDGTATTTCTPSQSQQPSRHKFVTECRTSNFYGMVTTKCYEVDVTQRWIDFVGAQQPFREDDSPELRAAKMDYRLKHHPMLREDDPPELRAAKEAAFAKSRSPYCTKGLDCVYDENFVLRDPVCPSAQGLARLRPCGQP
jgi:hypothetical protein